MVASQVEVSKKTTLGSPESAGIAAAAGAGVGCQKDNQAGCHFDEAFWFECERLWRFKVMSFVRGQFPSLSHEDIEECWNDALLGLFENASKVDREIVLSRGGWLFPFARRKAMELVNVANYHARAIAGAVRPAQGRCTVWNWRQGLGVYDEVGGVRDVAAARPVSVHRMDVRVEALELVLAEGRLSKSQLEKLDLLRVACESGEYESGVHGGVEFGKAVRLWELQKRCRDVLREMMGPSESSYETRVRHLGNLRRRQSRISRRREVGCV